MTVRHDLRSVRRVLRIAGRGRGRRIRRVPPHAIRVRRWGGAGVTADAWLSTDHVPALPITDSHSRRYADFWQCRSGARCLLSEHLPIGPSYIARAVAVLRVAYYGPKVAAYAHPAAREAIAASDSAAAYAAAVTEWETDPIAKGHPDFTDF